MQAQMGSLSNIELEMYISVLDSIPNYPVTLYCVEFTAKAGENFKLALAFREMVTGVLSFAVEILPFLEND